MQVSIFAPGIIVGGGTRSGKGAGCCGYPASEAQENSTRKTRVSNSHNCLIDSERICNFCHCKDEENVFIENSCIDILHRTSTDNQSSHTLFHRYAMADDPDLEPVTEDVLKRYLFYFMAFRFIVRHPALNGCCSYPAC
ncbi:hypothetical protein Ciccas_004594 [Cichlidogyrus casuarinus]|uniref:Uncharacterized protein n=1 Tax=Cichlidogyrus casuarinus TaxID=1844966 RepID=A0ABD2QBJ3_9PLAT